MKNGKIPGYENPELEAMEAGEKFAVGESHLVTVKMFEREYQIQSDQPQLVELLVDEINREAKKLKESSPVKMGPGHFDWPVQVAFRLALSRFKALEAYNTLKRQIDAETDKMTRRINTGLQDMEVEKITMCINNDLADLELDNNHAQAHPVAGLDDQETEKLALRITADLDNLDTDQLAERVSAGLDKLDVDAEKIARRLMDINLDEQQ